VPTGPQSLEGISRNNANVPIYIAVRTNIINAPRVDIFEQSVSTVTRSSHKSLRTLAESAHLGPWTWRVTFAKSANRCA